jgi:hypothetical protein
MAWKIPRLPLLSLLIGPLSARRRQLMKLPNKRLSASVNATEGTYGSAQTTQTTPAPRPRLRIACLQPTLSLPGLLLVSFASTLVVLFIDLSP